VSSENLAASGDPRAPRVVITDARFAQGRFDIERSELARIGADLVIATGTREEVLTAAGDADALLTTFFELDAAAIAGLSRCRVISRYGVGYDQIDVAAAVRSGITVTYCPEYCTEEVAAHALALILMLVRRLPQADHFVRSGEWGAPRLGPILRLSETTVGIVGYGRIGRRLAASLQQLRVRLLVHDPRFQDGDIDIPLVSLDELLRSSDVVSLHAPLSTATRGMIGRAQLAAMRESAVLVNTARGSLVVLDDLLDALRTGRLRGAALDVFPVEPPDPAAFVGVPNLIVSPHLAYYSDAAVRELQRTAARQVVQVLSGRAPDFPVPAP
jgi:D-3-phosphoglycerate dehydrogenase / 2-oxoglutarate reductase